MKMKVLNRTLAPTRMTGLYISVSGTAGIISFSKQLGDKLNLATVGVNFIQDEDRPGDWYIQPSKDPDAFPVRSKTSDPKAAGHYVIQSSAVCHQIFDSCKLERITHRFIVAAEPIEEDLYAIITKSAKKSPPAKVRPVFKIKHQILLTNANKVSTRSAR